MTTEPIPFLPLILFFFVLSHASKLTYNSRTSTLENKDKALALDGAPLVVGVITVLKQFHSIHTHTFLAYLGQYVRSHVSASPAGMAPGKLAITPEVVSVLLFLEEYCKSVISNDPQHSREELCVCSFVALCLFSLSFFALFALFLFSVQVQPHVSPGHRCAHPIVHL